MGRRKAWTAQHASNAPCEDVAVVTQVGQGDLVAVFDGHGGRDCASFAAETLPACFKDGYTPPVSAVSGLDALRARFFASGSTSATEAPARRADASESLAAAFRECDRRWMSEHSCKPGAKRLTRSGSCALVCFCDAERAVVANAGDCRAVLASKRQPSAHVAAGDAVDYKVTALSLDHTAQNEKERLYVKQRTKDPVPFRSSIKSVVVNEDLPLRVAGSLMVTRALGDGYLKRADLSSPPFRQYCPYITADPEVLVYSICSEDDFVILASDGVPYSGNKSLQRRILKLVKSTVILPIF